MDTNSESLVWNTINPLGCAVNFKTSTFEIHIISDNKRTEFKGEEMTLKQVVERPRIIIPDKEYTDTRHEYGDLCYLKELGGFYWVKVIVDHSVQPNDVVTALATRTIPKILKENIIYESATTNSI